MYSKRALFDLSQLLRKQELCLCNSLSLKFNTTNILRMTRMQKCHNWPKLRSTWHFAMLYSCFIFNWFRVVLWNSMLIKTILQQSQNGSLSVFPFKRLGGPQCVVACLQAGKLLLSCSLTNQFSTQMCRGMGHRTRIISRIKIPDWYDLSSCMIWYHCIICVSS